MTATDRTTGIFFERQLTELHLPTVEEQEPGNEWVAESDDQLDHFQRLQRSDNSRQHTEHAAFRARWNEIGWGRLAVQTPITWTLRGGEHGDLSVEPEHRSVHVGLGEQHARIVDEIARRKIVGAIDDDVEAAEDVQRVRRGQSIGERFDLDVRVDVVQSVPRCIDLAQADFRRAVENLALQVAAIDDVEVRDPQRSDTGGGEIQSSGRTQSTGAYEHHARGAPTRPVRRAADAAGFARRNRGGGARARTTHGRRWDLLPRA